jgi:hypothetical protein
MHATRRSRINEHLIFTINKVCDSYTSLIKTNATKTYEGFMNKEYRNYEGLKQLHNIMSEIFYDMVELDCVNTKNHLSFHLLKSKKAIIAMNTKDFEMVIAKWRIQYDDILLQNRKCFSSKDKLLSFKREIHIAMSSLKKKLPKTKKEQLISFETEINTKIKNLWKTRHFD